MTLCTHLSDFTILAYTGLFLRANKNATLLMNSSPLHIASHSLLLSPSAYLPLSLPLSYSPKTQISTKATCMAAHLGSMLNVATSTGNWNSAGQYRCYAGLGTSGLVSYPDPTLSEGKGLGTLKRFLGRAHQRYIISTAHEGARYFRSCHSLGAKREQNFIKLYHRRHPC